MSVPTYERYRDSGVDWLGAVPSHWGVAPIKAAFSVIGGSTPKSDVPQYWGGAVPWITPADLSRVTGLTIGSSIRTVTEEGVASCGTTKTPAGSVVLSTRAPIGSTAVTTVESCTNQGCKTMVPKGPLASSLLAFALSVSTEQLNVRGRGTTFLELPADELGAFAVPVPPIEEQSAIISFLDRETAKIDALVEEQRRLIRLLKEKRQAVISHAVTKGLDPSAPMKDSSVEWLGEVPAHWEVSQSRRMFAVRSEAARPGDRMLTASQKYGVLYQSDFVELEGRRVVEVIQGLDSLRRVEVNDFIISMRSFQGGLEWSRLQGATSFHYVMVRPIKWVHPAFFAHLFKSSAYIQALRATTDLIRDGQELRYSHFTKVHLPIVPIEEQELIANFLDSETVRYDALVGESERLIALLQERRATLISAAVTGKIDVRGWSAADVRRAVAAQILYFHSSSRTFGRVKNQKILYLAETHACIHEIGGHYVRDAAGPYDSQLLSNLETMLEQDGILVVNQPQGPGSTVSYSVARGRRPDESRLMAMLGNRLAALDNVNRKLAELDTRGAEAVATLYAVWNDALIDGQPSADDDIIDGFLHHWHPEKPLKFKKAELQTWLFWMRRNGLVPKGQGPRTDTGRLFV